MFNRYTLLSYVRYVALKDNSVQTRRAAAELCGLESDLNDRWSLMAAGKPTDQSELVGKIQNANVIFLFQSQKTRHETVRMPSTKINLTEVTDV